jgi:hypothetical protein
MENLRKRVKESCFKNCYIIRGDMQDMIQLHQYLNEKSIENRVYVNIIYIPFPNTPED